MPGDHPYITSELFRTFSDLPTYPPTNMSAYLQYWKSAKLAIFWSHPPSSFAFVVYGWSLGFFIFLHNAVRFGRFMGKNISKPYFHVWFWQNFYPKVKPWFMESVQANVFLIVKWTVLVNKSAVLTKLTRSKNYDHWSFQRKHIEKLWKCSRSLY